MLLRAWMPRHHDSVPNAPAVFGYGCVRVGDTLYVPVLAVHGKTRAKTLRAQLHASLKQRPERCRVVWPGLEPGEHRNIQLQLLGGSSAAQTRR